MASQKFQRAVDGAMRQCLDLAAERLGSLVGSETQFRTVGVVPLSASDYAAKNRKKTAALMLETAEGEGHSLVLIRIQEAILLAGTLLMLPQAQIKETIRTGELGQDLTDAFNEVANIVYGAVDEVVHGISPDKGKLRNEGVQLIDPSRESGLETLWPPGNCWGGELSMTFPGFQAASAWVLFDEALLEQVLGIPAGEAAAEGGEVGPRTILVFGGDPEIAVEIRSGLEGLEVDVVHMGDAAKAIEGLGRKPLLLFIDFKAGIDAGLKNVCDAAGKARKEVPMIGISANPTKETILLARNAGAKAFLVHPCQPETVRTKVEPFLASRVKS